MVLLKVKIEAFIGESKKLAQNTSLEESQMELLEKEMEDLMPFTYKKQHTSNIVYGVLNMGNEQLVDYIFGRGSECNIRS